MRRCRLFLIAAALSLASTARPVEPARPASFEKQSWQAENGLPQNTVQAIVQTRDGYIWVGTEGGLARFDGLRFRVFNTQNTPELKSNNVRSLRAADDGGLEILTAAGALQFGDRHFNALKSYKVKGVETANLPSLGISGRVTAICHANNGVLWAGTESGLTRIIQGRVEPLAADNSFSGIAIRAITEDREGDIWIGTEDNGLSVLRAESFETFTTRDGLPDDNVRCVFGEPGGTVWVGTDTGGLARYADGRFSILTTRNGLASNAVLALGADRNGSLLVGTPDGLNRWQNGVAATLTAADGLPDDFVRSIALAADGAVWVGTRRGVARILDERITTYNQAQGLGSDLAGAMISDGTGSGLWIATRSGLTRFDGVKFSNYTVRDGLSSSVITALYRDAEGVVWIGTEGGLHARIDNRFVRAKLADLPEAIYGLAEDGEGNLWISSRAGVFSVKRDALVRQMRGERSRPTVIPYGASDGLEVSESSGGGRPSIWGARDGSMWFATLKGVALLRDRSSHVNRVKPPVTIEAVFVDDQPIDAKELLAIAPGHERIAFEYAGLSYVAPQKVRYRYKLEGFDREWVEAGTRRVAFYTNLPPRRYRFRVQACNNDGYWNEEGANAELRLEPHYYQTYWFYAAILGVVGLLAYSVYRWRVRQVEAQFTAVLRERNRIAREIHDTLAQGFVAVSVQLELVTRLMARSADEAKEHLDQARTLVRRCLEEARQSIWELRSQSDQQDLAARLSKMAGQVAGTSPKVSLAVHGAYRPLAQNIEGELVKIAQEAVINAVRHAGAEHIGIELVFDSKRLKMTVKDDGRGFTYNMITPAPYGHFGLQGMRERAEAIGAEFNVKSTAGNGTEISVETSVQ